jgi:carbamoyl-phosphate synthase large subunit
MKGPLNILLLSAGRRKRLYELIQETMNELEISGTIYVADANPFLSSVCMDTPHFLTCPRVIEPNYISVLKQLILDHQIHIIIPTIDTELRDVSKLDVSQFLHSVMPVISSLDIVDYFDSKIATESFFVKNGFKTPKIIANPTFNDLPLFAKLDQSSASIGAQVVKSSEQLQYLLSLDESYVFQEYIQGVEFTVDAYINRKGEILGVVP